MKDAIASFQKNSREVVAVTVETYQGHDLVNIRVWFEGRDGEMRPGRQGLAIGVAKLRDLRDALEIAEWEAAYRGLLPGGDPSEREDAA